MVCMVCMVYGLYGMLEFKLCCEILLLLNMVDVDRWKTLHGVSNAEYLVHLVHLNRLHACRVLWGVYTCQLEWHKM